MPSKKSQKAAEKEKLSEKVTEAKTSESEETTTATLTKKVTTTDLDTEGAYYTSPEYNNLQDEANEAAKKIDFLVGEMDALLQSETVIGPYDFLDQVKQVYDDKLHHANDHNAHLDADLKHIKSIASASETAFNNLQKDHEDYKNKHNEEYCQKAAEQLRTEKNFKNQILGLQEELQQTKAIVATKQAAFEALTKEHESYKTEQAKIMAAQQDEFKRREESTKKNFAEEIGRFQATIAHLEKHHATDLAIHKEETKCAQNQIKALTEEMSHLVNFKVNMGELFEELKKKILVLERAKDALEKKLHYSEHLHVTSQDEVLQLQSTIAKKDSELKNLAIEFEHFKEAQAALEIHHHEEHVRFEQAMLDKFAIERKGLEDTIAAMELRHRTEVDGLNVDIAALHEKIQKLIEETHNLLHDKQKLSSLSEELTAKYKLLEANKANVDAKLKTAEEQVNALKKEVAELKQKLEDTTEALDDSEALAQSHANTIERLKADIDELHAARKRAAEHEHEVHAQIEAELRKKYDEQIHVLEFKMHQMEHAHGDELKKFNDELAALKEKIKQLLAELDTTQHAKHKLTVEVTEMAAKLMLAEKSKAKADEKTKKSEATVAELTTDLQETKQKLTTAEEKLKESKSVLTMKETLLRHYKKELDEAVHNHKNKEAQEHTEHVKFEEDMRKKFAEQTQRFEADVQAIRKESNDEFVRLRGIISERDSVIQHHLSHLDELQIKVRELEATNEVKTKQWADEKSALEASVENYRQKVLEQTHATLSGTPTSVTVIASSNSTDATLTTSVANGNATPVKTTTNVHTEQAGVYVSKSPKK